MSPQRSAELVEFMAACDLAVVSYLSPEGTPQSAVVGIAVTPVVAIAYLIVAALLFLLSYSPASVLDRTAPHEALPEPAE